MSTFLNGVLWRPVSVFSKPCGSACMAVTVEECGVSVASVDKPIDAWLGDDEEDCAKDGKAVGSFSASFQLDEFETVFHDFSGGDHPLRG